MHKLYKNCSIENIIRSATIPRLQFDVHDENDSHIQTIRIQNYNVYDQLKELISSQRGRAILAFGMTDIDIWTVPHTNRNEFRIEFSPTPAIYIDMIVNRSEIEKIIDMIAE